MAEQGPTPAEEVQRLYSEAESTLAKAMEDLVSRDSFASLLVRVTENVLGAAQLAGGALDLVVRNARLAGRADVVRLARMIGRTEDKLELLLQEVERLHARLDALESASPPAAAPKPSAQPRRGRTT